MTRCFSMIEAKRFVTFINASPPSQVLTISSTFKGNLDVEEDPVISGSPPVFFPYMYYTVVYSGSALVFDTTGIRVTSASMPIRIGFTAFISDMNPVVQVFSNLIFVPDNGDVPISIGVPLPLVEKQLGAFDGVEFTPSSPGVFRVFFSSPTPTTANVATATLSAVMQG